MGEIAKKPRAVVIFVPLSIVTINFKTKVIKNRLLLYTFVISKLYLMKFTWFFDQGYVKSIGRIG